MIKTDAPIAVRKALMEAKRDWMEKTLSLMLQIILLWIDLMLKLYR